MQIRSALRTILINVGIFVGLVLGVLLLTALAGDVHNLAKSFFPKNDKRASLPSYEDHDYALEVFRNQKGRIKGYVPYVEWRHVPLQSSTLNIDENGRRVHSIGRDNVANAVNIGFFGGSTMWGTGVDDNGTIAAQFDAITRNYEVTNFGERGYTTMQNLVDLMTLMNEQRAPEVVVFYEGFNDIWVHCDYAVTERLNGHMEERRMQSALDRTESENYLYNAIYVPIADFVTRVAIGRKADHSAACSNDSKRADAVAEMFVRTLEMAQILVSANGGRFHAFLHPHAFVGSPRVDHLDLTGQRNEGQRAQFAAVYPLIRQKMAARGYDWFTDISRALDGDVYLLVDHAHITTKGNALIAELIRQSLD
jgi:hypothetical protein